MENEQDKVIEKLKEVTSDILRIIGFSEFVVEVKTDPIEKKSLFMSIRSPQDVSFLIGRGGGMLNDFQMILNAIFKKNGAESFVLVDVNDYRRERVSYLKDLANKLAKKTVQTKTAEVMEPMPFYERKIVHIELSSRPDVITESQGHGPERHVVIKPYVF
jgi:spoIIIJ-associated protein